MTDVAKPELQAADPADTEAMAQILQLMRECQEGKNDREAEALEIARARGFDIEPIVDGFKEARHARQPAAAPKLVVVNREPLLNRRRLVIEKPKPDGDREALLAAAAALRAEPKPEPEPEPQPEPEPVAAQGNALVVVPKSEIVPLNETEEEKALREMNDKHAVISNLGGKCVIMEWVPSAISEGQKELSYQSFQAFRERYANQHIMVPAGGGKGWQTAPFGPIWLSHPHRRQYEGLDLVPNGPPVGYLNLWKGWGSIPARAVGD